jgi:hypothetical protein
MRSWVIAQHRHSSLSRAAEEVTSLAVFRRPGAASEARA